MNRPVPRADIEKFTAALAEKRRRLAKAEHSTRGYRDEDGVWRGGLLSFVRYFWHVLEPGTPFTDGWVPEAICEHLEAVTFGEITNLLINVFPGATKSLFTNVFWPAWEWGPMELEHIRYVTFSYSASNTERDNQRFGDLVSCPDYQSMYSHVDVRQKGFEMVSNRKHGWKWASSVTGSATGKRGNRAICFPADQLVQTERGVMRIGDIVEQRMDISVWSYNRSLGAMELKPIEAWHRNPGRRLIKITLEDGHSVTCTEDHPILSAIGYRLASRLTLGEPLCCFQFSDGWQSQMAPCSAVPDVVDRRAFYPELFRERIGAFLSAASDVPYLFFGKFGKSIFMDGVFSTSSAIIGLQSQVQMPPDATSSNAAYGSWTNPKLKSEFSSQSIGLGGNLPNHILGKVRSAVSKRPMALAISNVLRSRSVLKIIPSWVASISILVSDFLSFGTRTDESSRDERMSHDVHALAVASQGDARVALNDRPSHDFSGHQHVLSGPENVSRKTFDAAEVGNFVEVKSDNRTPYLACITSIEHLHEIPSVTYCLTVQGNHNLVCGSDASVICSNCDDLNNVKESESSTVLNETNRWFRESLSSRLNNIETDAKVVIAQRVAEGDVSGEILALGLPYCHLMIPMEYEWQADENGEPYTTEIGWVDPRWKPNPEDCEGELAWPQRFSETSVRSLKIELGEFATAAQLQQTPAPRGGGIIKREDWLPAEQYMDGNKFPSFSFVIASLDGAFDEKESSDYSALTVWGVFQNEHGYNRAMLIHAWAKRLPISGPRMEIEPGEHELMFRRRAMPTWGLVEWVADTCNRFKADKLLIENKASGKPAAQTLQNSHGRQGWSIVLVEPKGDKYARGLAVQPSFSQGMIYAPDRDWATADGMVIDQCAKFPKAKHDDLFDSTTQAIKHLRDSGLLRSDEDRRAEEVEAVRHKGAPRAAPYPGFRQLARR